MRPRRSHLRATMVSAALSLIVACSSGPSSPIADESGPTATLHAAAVKTLAVKSFHADATYRSSGNSGPGMVDYQAPDRASERFGGEDPHETISIGNTIYFSVPGRPDYFWKIDGRGRGA